MDALKYLLHGMMKDDRKASESTQAGRRKILNTIADQLKEDGYKSLRPESLKPKHVTHLIERWQKEGLSLGTIKNRMAHVRWWAGKVGKSHMIPKSNMGTNGAMKLNIANRSYIPTESKGKNLDLDKLNLVTNSHIKLSLQLQKEFGLRRAESIKFKPSFAIRGDTLSLKASWCKGGRAREIPIKTESQRALLAEVKAFAGNGSLIPQDKSYVKQLKKYEDQCKLVGLCKNHGLRHRYAQDRYETLTGWKCPIEGGISKKDMTPEEKEIDRAVRLEITEELGHCREQITVTYLGR